MDSDLFKKVVWDYDMTQDEFEAILSGTTIIGSFDQNWAIARILENCNYYDAMSLISQETLLNNWEKIRPKLFNNSIIKGYEFVLHRHSLSDSK